MIFSLQLQQKKEDGCATKNEFDLRDLIDSFPASVQS